MSTRPRPADCCGDPRPVSMLPQAERAAAAVLFKALGDETRLEVFRLIAGQAEPICVCDIVDRFAVSQPTISHHLKALREAGLVRVSRRGTWAFYAANPERLAVVRQFVDALTSQEVGAR